MTDDNNKMPGTGAEQQQQQILEALIKKVQQDSHVIQGLAATMSSIQRKLQREQERLPPISSDPVPFQMYLHFTSKNYMNHVIKSWMEKSGIPYASAPNMLKRGWPNKKQQVEEIVEASIVNGQYNMEAVYTRIDTEIININKSVLDSMYANIRRKKGELYSGLFHRIKTLAKVVNENATDNELLNVVKKKFKELIHLEQISDSRTYILATVFSQNYENINEFDLQRKLWDCENLFSANFKNTPSHTINPGVQQPDEDMDVSAMSAVSRAGTKFMRKQGSGRGKSEISVYCPNAKCKTRYNKFWCYPYKKEGYRWCGKCRTELNLTKPHPSSSNNINQINSGHCNVPMQETTRHDALINGRERHGPRGNWSRSTHRCPRACCTADGRALGVGTASKVVTVHKPHAVVKEALASFGPDEGSTKLQSGFMTDEEFQELENLEDPTPKRLDVSQVRSDPTGIGRQSGTVETKTSKNAQFGSDDQVPCESHKSCDIIPSHNNDEGINQLAGNGGQPIFLGIRVAQSRKIYQALVDTGSVYSIMNEPLYNYLWGSNVPGIGELEKSSCKLTTANGNPMGVAGEANILCTLYDTAKNQRPQIIRFLICRSLRRPFLLGLKHLRCMGDAYIDLKTDGFFFERDGCTHEKDSVNVVTELLQDQYGGNKIRDEEIIDTPTFKTFDTCQENLKLQNGDTLIISSERSSKFKNNMVELFNSYQDVLIDKNKLDIGTNKKYIAEIKNTRKPKTCYKYMASKPLHRQIMQEKVGKLIDQKVVEFTNEPANSQTFLVEKHNSFNNDDPRHYRVVNDLRNYNQTVQPHVFHNRTAKDMLAEFCSSKIFSVTDASDAYHTVPYNAQYPIISTIPGSNKNIRWKRLPQGLTNAGAFYAESMETCFPRTEFPQCARYADDSLVHTMDENEHIETWRKMLQRYRESGLKVDMGSTRIGFSEVDFLNFRIANQQYSIGAKHRQTIQQLTNWQKDVETVVGFVQYLSDFLKEKQPLLHKLRRHMTDGWTDDNKDLAEQIQQILLSSDHLGVPDHNTPVHIFVDAGNEGYASGMFTSKINKAFDKMSKTEKEQIQLCAFYSKDCSDSKRWSNKSTYEKELTGLVDAKSRYDFYINGSHPTYIYTDNKSVAESAKSRSPRIRAMFDELEQYSNVKIVQIDTKSNLADVFTRNMQLNDNSINVVTRRAARKQTALEDRQKILDRALAFHKEGGHPSAERIRKYLEERYTENPGLVPTRKEIEEMLKDCVCQQRKIDHGRELFQIPTPKSTNHVIFIDYKNLNGMKILSILEGLSGAYFPIPLKNEETRYLIEELTKFFMIYGRCKTIVADNGKTFSSDEFRKYCNSLGISLKFVNIYSPKANKAERPHSTLNKALQLAKESKESNNGTIFGHIDLLKFSWTQNSIPKIRTEHSPFEIIKGGYCFGLYTGSDDLPAELQPNFKNNAVAEEAIQASVGRAFDKFTDDKQPELLEKGLRVRWIKKQNATSFEREATVIYDNKSSVLVQFDNFTSPSWVSKSDLTKIVN